MITNNEDTMPNQWHLSKSIPLSLIVALVGQTFVFIWWASSLSAQVQINAESIKQHVVDRELHISYKSYAQAFMPRSELNSRLVNIENTLLEIRQDVKELK